MLMEKKWLSESLGSNWPGKPVFQGCFLWDLLFRAQDASKAQLLRRSQMGFYPERSLGFESSAQSEDDSEFFNHFNAPTRVTSLRYQARRLLRLPLHYINTAVGFSFNVGPTMRPNCH